MKILKTLVFVLPLLLCGVLYTDRVRLCQKYNAARCGSSCSCCSFRLCGMDYDKCHCSPCSTYKYQRDVGKFLEMLRPKTETKDRSARLNENL